MATAALVAVTLPAVAAGAATPPGPFTIDVNDREAVRRFYYSTYLASDGVAPGWTGDVASCTAGRVSDDFLEATRTRINWFRAMAGVPSDVVFTAENNAKAQQTALMMAAQGQLSHAPPTSWACWTAAGAEGAAKSNLSLGNTGPAAISALVRDGTDLGHRRTILNPQTIEMGSGSIPATATKSASEAQFMTDNRDPALRPVRDGFVAWPSPGFVPSPVVYPLWHVSLRGATFANATVTMTRNGAPLGTRITNRSDFAGPGLVWDTAIAAGNTDGVDWPLPTRDDRYHVTVAGVVVGGATRTIDYDVTVFDPAVGDPARTPVVVTGPESPAVGTAADFVLNTIPNATGTQWRTTRLVTLADTQGAEGGLGAMQAQVGNYNPVSTRHAATGATSYRLSIGDNAPNPPTATLVDPRSIVPTATSELRFQSFSEAETNVAELVQVSTDDGATWRTLLTDPSTDDAAFVNRTVSLGAFAGQKIRYRFRTEPAGTGGWSIGAGTGWYVDDVTVTEAFVATSTLGDVSTSTTFSFTPADSVLVDIEARPVFFGSGAGAWSPAKRIAPAGPATITTQPRAVTARSGGSATFGAVAAGPNLGFRWSKDGVDLADGQGVSGSGSATLQLTDVTAAQAGTYRVRIGNPFGVVTSADAVLTVTAAPPTLAAALDTNGQAWATTGDGAWFGQTALSHDGVDAVRSGPIADLKQTTLTTAVTDATSVSFWWKVSSEQNFDFLDFLVDGTAAVTRISGDVDWIQHTVALTPGTHSLSWRYSKDANTVGGQDAAWVDQVVVISNAAPAQPPAPPVPAANPLAAALDAPGAAVGTAGAAAWFAQTTVTRDGVSAVRSGAIGDNGASALALVVSGPATVSFWWKVSSELNFDFLRVDVDGVAVIPGISGDVDWQQQTLTIPAGTHSVRWVYAKDSSVANGVDAGWVDQLTIR